MQEKVEKYIYIVSENKYRVKFKRIDRKKNVIINFDEYIYGNLDEATKLRDDKLKENGLTLKDIKVIQDIFCIEKKTRIKTNPNNIKKLTSTSFSSSSNKVEKYIYEIDKGKKYRIFIRKGAGNGQKGDYYSSVFEGTLSQAKKERDRKLAELKLKNGKVDKGGIKFIDFARIYYKEFAEKELSPSTVMSGKSSLKNYILPEIANTPLNKIDGLTIQRIINNLKDRKKERLDKNSNVVNLSPTTINTAYRLMKKIFNKAIAWDYITSNPVLKVKSPGVSKKEKESYNRDEILKILELLKEEDLITETLFTIAICTGLRRGELVGLHVNDIDFKNNIVHIKRAVIWDKANQKVIEKDTKTKGSVRDVPIPLFCTELIKEYINFRLRLIQRFKNKDINYATPDNLFLDRNGGIMFPDTPSSKWLKFRNKHTLLKEVSLHGLRHSYCTMQMNENPNLSPADVKKLMGHSQLTTTFIYTHSNEDKKDETVSIFDKYYSSFGEKKISFNEILSLYTKINFTTSDKIQELINFMISEKDEEEENYEYNKIKDYIESKYPMFNSINTNNINLTNVWDWLEICKSKYGNEFIISPIG